MDEQLKTSLLNLEFGVMIVEERFRDIEKDLKDLASDIKEAREKFLGIK